MTGGVEGTPERLRVGVYDPCPLRVEGFLALFSGHRSLEFVPCDLAALARDHSIGLALVGWDGRFDALAIVSAVRTLHPSRPVVLMGPPAEEEQLISVISAGAKGYLEYTAGPDQVEQAIAIVSTGSIWVPRRVLAAFVERTNRRHRPGITHPGQLHFTPREQQVLRELTAGGSNAEIARALGMEERTVKMHIGRLLRKIGVENRVALSAFAIRQNALAKPSE